MATYKIDHMHSEVKFKVKHLMISTVTGHFRTFDATMEAAAADFSDANIAFEADINSIDTNMEQRDTHLKSDDFFNADAFPKLSFKSTSIAKTGDSTLEVTGDLTIRDVTKAITLKAEYGGTMVDFYGQTKHGFDLTGKLSRQDFNLKWNAVTEAGGVVVADEVKLELNVQMALQA
jgi:polyisoprenoid-binding protein YceI